MRAVAVAMAVAGVVLAEWSFASLVCGLAFMFLVFPTGHLPSPRWRPVEALALLVIALTMTGFLIHPRQVALPAPGGISLTFQNPLGVSLPGPLATVLIGAPSRRTGVPVRREYEDLGRTVLRERCRYITNYEDANNEP